MNSPEISIVIPIYNSEKYIRRCLDSVIAQTFSEWEAICVNDGSKDNSLQILREYESKDSRIKVIDSENHGVSHARNMGIDAATGKYIGFVDSDDMIEPQMYEFLWRAMSEKENRIVICKYEVRTELNGATQEYNAAVADLRTVFPLNDTMFWGVSVCNKLFPTNAMRNLHFNEDIYYGEDLYMSGILCSEAEDVVFVDNVLYNYYPNSSSAMSQLNPKYLTSVESCERCYEAVKDKNSTQITAYCLAKMFKVILSMRLMFKGTEYYNVCIKQCRKCFRRYKGAFVSNGIIDIKMKLGILVFWYFPFTYEAFRKRGDSSLR